MANAKNSGPIDPNPSQATVDSATPVVPLARGSTVAPRQNIAWAVSPAMNQFAPGLPL